MSKASASGLIDVPNARDRPCIGSRAFDPLIDAIEASRDADTWHLAVPCAWSDNVSLLRAEYVQCHRECIMQGLERRFELTKVFATPECLG